MSNATSKNNILRILTIILCSLLLIIKAYSQDNEFKKANDLYSKNKYQEALDVYKIIENKNLESFELYYNMGNCYYRLNEIANSILYYEKAKKLNPLNEDLIQNLKLANLKTVDRIEYKEILFFEKIALQILFMFSSNSWAIISIIFLLLASLLFVTKTKLTGKTKQNLSIAAVSFLLIFCITTIISWKAKNFNTNNNLAVVFSNSLNSYSEPNNSSTLLFTIHEGTLIEITEISGDWVNIKLPTGVNGWVPKLSIRTI